MICTKCGLKIHYDWAFCPKCATPVSKEISTKLLWEKLEILNKNFKRLEGKTVVEHGLIGAKFVKTKKVHVCNDCHAKIKTSAYALTSSETPIISEYMKEDEFRGIHFVTQRGRPTRIYRCLVCAHKIIKNAEDTDSEVRESQMFDYCDYGDNW